MLTEDTSWPSIQLLQRAFAAFWAGGFPENPVAGAGNSSTTVLLRSSSRFSGDR